MRALVFGQSGQVATELALQVPTGVVLTALGRDQADLTCPDDCARTVVEASPDVVINAAAFTAVDLAESQERLATTVNGEAPGAIARSCAALGIPFLHVSTDYVFDGTGFDPWTPDAPVAPINAYGRSKRQGEDEIRTAGGPHAILRTSWVVSAHGNNFIKTMLRLSQSHASLRIVGDQIGGPTPAADIASALWMMAADLVRDDTKSGTYHFSGAPDVSWADFAREIFHQADRAVQVEDIPTSAYPTPAARPANSRLDCTATQDAFGIARPDWHAGLSRILETLKDTTT